MRLNAVLSWLAANPGWLLILDNIDAPAALAEADRLMGRLAGGHVILTSRLDRFARQVEPLELDVLARPPPPFCWRRPTRAGVRKPTTTRRQASWPTNWAA